VHDEVGGAFARVIDDARTEREGIPDAVLRFNQRGLRFWRIRIRVRCIAGQKCFEQFFRADGSFGNLFRCLRA